VSFAGAARECIAFYGELSLRTRLLTRTLVALPLRDREMNERYLEVETLAGRALSDAAKGFVRFLIEAIRAETLLPGRAPDHDSVRGGNPAV
jgi:hypothetical protein